MSVPGLQYDIEKLLTTFVETDSVRFQDFSKIWRNLNMSRIVNGRVTHNDYRVILEDAYRICLIFITSQYNEQVRIGALYTLYSFYFSFNFTKPAETTGQNDKDEIPSKTTPNLRKKLTLHQYHRNCAPIQIRIVPEYWNHLQSLLAWIRQNDHIDAEYVFKKLEISHSFVVCAGFVPAARTELWNGSRVHKDIRCGLPIYKKIYESCDFIGDQGDSGAKGGGVCLASQTASHLPKFLESTNTKKLLLVADKYGSLNESDGTNLNSGVVGFESKLKGSSVSEDIKKLVEAEK